MVVMDWAARLLGLDDSFLCKSKIGGGIILGSASESCLTAAIAARERCLKMMARSMGKLSLDGKMANGISVNADGSRVKDTDGDVPDDVREAYMSKLVIYASTQTHSLGKKVSTFNSLFWNTDFLQRRAGLINQSIARPSSSGSTHSRHPFPCVTGHTERQLQSDRCNGCSCSRRRQGEGSDSLHVDRHYWHHQQWGGRPSGGDRRGPQVLPYDLLPRRCCLGRCRLRSS